MKVLGRKCIHNSKYYASAEEYTPHDYNGTIFAAIDLSLNHDENKMFSKDLMWNVLQALSLFSKRVPVPSCVVKLAWKSMQPEGEAEYFEAVVNSLIHKNLVDESVDEYLELHDLVCEYVELKKPIDLVTILCDQEGELKQGRELLAIFLFIYGKKNDDNHVKMLLWQAGADFNEIFIFQFSVHALLDSDAENAILAIFQLYKATQQDAKALLHLICTDDYQAFVAARVLVWLMINFGGENLLVDGDIEKFVWLCTHYLQNISLNLWRLVMLEMANCRVFAKKMICHQPLLILIVERIQKDDAYILDYVQILVALTLHVQGIKNTKSKDNLLEEDKDVMREPMKSRVLDNTCVSHVVLYHGENSSRGTEVPFFEPKFLSQVLQLLLQHIQMSATSRDTKYLGLLSWSSGYFIEFLDCLVDITNGATHFVEYGCVELFFSLEEPRWNGMTFEHAMKLFCHRVIFESISSNGRIHSLVSILKHGTKKDIMSVPWILKYLAIGHEEVALQLITEVGVEKMAEGVELWEGLCPGAMVELWLRHEGIARGMILEGHICESLTRVIHQNSEVCRCVLSNLIKYHGDIVAEDLDAKGGLQLFLACYNMQPLNPTWIQLLRDMAQNKAFAKKMVALGNMEWLQTYLNLPMSTI